jgi:nitrate/TMAO reductase-like tetraheme cytochrome c subunit
MRRRWTWLTGLGGLTLWGTSLGAAGAFFAAGVIAWGGFNTAVEWTNRLDFCISCHEMTWVHEEWQERVHHRNATGVQADCADCHVPRDWGPKMMRKLVASREVWYKLLGTINTEEKFEDRRLLLAERVWRSMERTDSRECRNCHDWTAMDLESQRTRARRSHEQGVEEGLTCISCHQGIAHELPEGWEDRYDELFGVDLGPQEFVPLLLDDPEPEAPPEPPPPVDEPIAQPELIPEPEPAEAVALNAAMAIDWAQIPPAEIIVFYPGQTSIEWMLDGRQHGGARAFRAGDRCLWCHEGEEELIGTQALASEGELDLTPIPGKRPSVPLIVQAAYDEDTLYMRFQWPEGEHVPVPFVEGGRMDPENPFRLTVSFADDSVEMAEAAGCWASCHHDSRHMPDAPDPEPLLASPQAERLDLTDGVTKYLQESRTEIEIRGRDVPRGGWDKLRDDEELQALREQGVFLDLAHFRAGEGLTRSGHVLEERVMEDTQAIAFQAELVDGVWTVWLARALQPGTAADKPLLIGQLYNLGIALHDDFAISRFHHVSWQYLLGFDDEEAEINARRLPE